MAVAKNPVETIIQRRLIKAHIRAESVQLVLMRPTFVKTDSGGLKKGEPTPIAAQTMRLIPFKRRLTVITRDTPDGNIINLAYVLLGEHDADVEVGDFFQWDGGWYDVQSIEPNRAFRTAANITYRGKRVDDAWSG